MTKKEKIEKLLKFAELGYNINLALKMLDLELSEVEDWTLPKSKKIFIKEYKIIQVDAVIEIETKLWKLGMSGDKQSLLKLRENAIERQLTLTEKEGRAYARNPQKQEKLEDLTKEYE